MNSKLCYRILALIQKEELLTKFISPLEEENNLAVTVPDQEAFFKQFSEGKFDLLIFDEDLINEDLPNFIEHFRSIDKRPRSIVLIEDHVENWRECLQDFPINICFEKKHSVAMFLLVVDSVLKSLPKIDLITHHFKVIKEQIEASNKSKEGLRHIISSMPEAINHLQPIDKFLRGILTQICGFLHCQNSFLATIEKKNDLELFVGTGVFKDEQGALISEKIPEELNELIQNSLGSGRSLIKERFVLLPLRGNKKVLGIFYLEKSKADMDPLEEDMLKLFANQVSIIIENANLYEEATRDSLTGMYVRRYFFNKFRDVLLYASRIGGQSLSLLMVDIDHFKSINDTYGHPMGDQVLKDVAAVVLNNSRKTDIVSRFGGEEFAILLVDTDKENAQHFAEQLCEKIRALNFEYEGKKFSITVSVGLASFDDYALPKEKMRDHDTKSMVELDQKNILKAADDALYHSKQNGRDQITVAQQFPKSYEVIS